MCWCTCVCMSSRLSVRQSCSQAAAGARTSCKSTAGFGQGPRARRVGSADRRRIVRPGVSAGFDGRRAPRAARCRRSRARPRRLAENPPRIPRIEASSHRSLQSSATGRPRFLPSSSSSSSPSECRKLLPDGSDRSMRVREGRERARTPERVPRDGSGSARARAARDEKRDDTHRRADWARKNLFGSGGVRPRDPAWPRGAGAF